MAPALPKLALPKIALPTLGRKQILTIVAGVVVAAAAGWAALQYFEDTPPPPPPKPVASAKQAGAAKAAAPSPDKMIADLLEASGLNQHLNQLPQQLVAGVKQSSAQRPRTSAAVSGAIEQAVAEAYTAQNFQDRLKADLNKNFEQKRVQALLSDLSAPAAKSMINLERASPPPEELAQFVRSGAANRLPAARSELVKRIDAATRASDLAVEAAFVSMRAVALGLAGAGARKADAIDKAIEKQRASATANIRSATFANLAFTYRDASDADLETYAKFYEADNSKWFAGLVYASLLEEIKSAAAQAGERVAALASSPGKPLLAQAAPLRSKSRADARACLDRATDAAIIKCAEQYR